MSDDSHMQDEPGYSAGNFVRFWGGRLERIGGMDVDADYTPIKVRHTEPSARNWVPDEGDGG